jgi:hypothetical protein
MAKINTMDPEHIRQGLKEGWISPWDEHAIPVVDDWEYEVANGYTRLGYWDWVIEKLESGDYEREEE